MRCRRTSTLPSPSSASRGFARRAWAPAGHLKPRGIVAVEEVVVPLRVAAELRVVALRGERERGAALPAPDHLRAEQCLLLTVRGLRAEVLPVGRHLRVQLAEDDVGAVSAEHVRGRHRRQLAGLVGVAEDDLAGLERPLLRVRRRPAAAFDRGLADPVLEAERGPPGRELVAVLTPDHLDAVRAPAWARRAFSATASRRASVGREHREGDVDVGRAERLLPVLRAALADVARGASARAAIPSRNSGAKLSSEACGTPSAFSP